MSETRVKVCGLTRAEDVRLAAGFGAWALGFVLTESPRRVDLTAVAALTEAARRAAVPHAPLTVVVFSTEDAAAIARATRAADADAVQLSAGGAGPSVAAVRAALAREGARDTVLVAAANTPDAADADFILRDRREPGAWGGTGRTLDWARLAADRGLRPERLVLAGGLTPDNVAHAVEAVRPFAVDASSGLESSPGVKDAAAMTGFFAAVSRADRGTGASRAHDTVEESPLGD